MRPLLLLCSHAALVAAVADEDILYPRTLTDDPPYPKDAYPGNETCGPSFKNAPIYHLMDQHGCAENDPNGPVFDPVHGVIHHFYQIHLAALPGHGPDYGHFVSKDFITWAQLPVAIWNGLDSSVWPPRVTKYDNEAIFTGSALVLDGAGPGGKGPGIVQIYPGLCNKGDWPACATGTLLAQAVPANYATDALLTNWTKPSYNPIVESTQRDPSTPWKTPSGEWRLRTYDQMVYGSASDEDLLAGKWYTIGKSDDFRQCECPSFYPLPASSRTPEALRAHAAATASGGTLPTHVHKTSCSGDWWQLGTYEAGAPKTLGSFNATPGWEDAWAQRKIDGGHFYASKDNLYPVKGSKTEQRRINWGWATVPPASAQTLPREITFNAATRQLDQYPIDEINGLRQAAVALPGIKGAALVPGTPLALPATPEVVMHSDLTVTFSLPTKGTFAGPLQLGVSASTGGADGDPVECTVSYSAAPNASAPYYDVPVQCGGDTAQLRLLPGETTVTLRLFYDATFVEAFFQGGRAAITEPVALATGTAGSRLSLIADGAGVTVTDAALYPMRSIWADAETVRKAPRVYG